MGHQGRKLPAATSGRFGPRERKFKLRHYPVGLWLDPGGITNDSRGDRPWVPHPVSARERAAAKAAE